MHSHTMIELINRDNVIVTSAEQRNSVDTRQCANDYANLMHYNMRADGMTAILQAIIDAVLPEHEEESNSGLLELAEHAIRDLADYDTRC